MPLREAIAEFEKRRTALLEDVLTLLRFPTISTQPQHAADMRACAAWLAGRLVSAGLTAEVLDTGGHPVVFADTGPADDGAAGPTLLFYAHYDVQPPGDPGLWRTPPFEPVVREGVIYARGSADNKGPLMAQVAAVQCWHAVNRRCPPRLKFLFEGEEEIGSRHLPAFIEANCRRLACDYVVITDTSKCDADTSALTCATRGLVCKEITIEGPTRDLHSGHYGGVVANPANTLARLIASLHDDDDRITIPGFYDDVLHLSDEQRRQIAGHAASQAELLARTGSPALSGETGFSAAERGTVRPALDVNGLIGGYTAPGSATIIPARATAKLSMRLVPRQDPQRVSKAFDDAIRRACPDTVRLTIATQAACAPYVAPDDSPGMDAARRALAESFPNPPALIRDGGTLPILPMFKQVLGADSLLLGLAMPDCNLHGPNEFFHLADFQRGTACIIRLIDLMASSAH